MWLAFSWVCNLCLLPCSYDHNLHSARPAIWPTKRLLVSNGDLFSRPIIFYFLDSKRPIKFKIVFSFFFFFLFSFFGTNTAIHRSNKIFTMNMWEREYNKCDMILLSWMSKLELSYLRLSPLWPSFMHYNKLSWLGHENLENSYVQMEFKFINSVPC